MSLTSLAALWGLLVLPAVVLLYFLKRKRNEHVISSTLLWKQATQDLRVNSPFQRLRKNLLLLLQLLILALIVFALAGPAMNRRAQISNRTLILIDNSGSMRTKDADGMTRLEKAKDMARRFVGDMAGDDEMMVVSFSTRPRVLQTWTQAESPLVKAINTVTPTDAETDVGEAIRIALGLAASRGSGVVMNTEDFEKIESAHNLEVTLISDGAFGDSRSLERIRLQVPVNYLKVGGASDNVGITALKTDRGLAEDSPLQLFARVENFSEEEVTCEAELWVSDALVDVQDLTIPAGRAHSLVYPMDEEDGLVKLHVKHPDKLQSDNTAYTMLRNRSENQVMLVGNKDRRTGKRRSNYFLDHALGLLPHTDVTDRTLDEYDHALHTDPETLLRYDVVIFDACAPATLEEGNVLMLGALPPVVGVRATGEAEKPALIDQSLHPVNMAIDYGNLYIQKAYKAEWPKRAVPLLDGDQGPLIVELSQGRLNLVAVTFDLAQSDWPLRLSFPLFVANAVKFLTESSAPRGAGSIKVGQPIIIHPELAATEIKISIPGRTRARTVKVYEDRRNRFTETDRAGIYQGKIKGTGEEKVFAVNMLSPSESRNDAEDTVALGAEKLEAKSESAVINQAAWKWFSFLALGIVLVEWYIYNRKTYL